MAPLLFSFAKSKRSTLSMLFTLCFLGSVATVVIPCPATERRRGGTRLDSDSTSAFASASYHHVQEDTMLSPGERIAEAKRLARVRYGFLEEGGGRR